MVRKFAMKSRLAMANLVAALAHHYPIEKGRRRILSLINTILPAGNYLFPVRLKNSQAVIHGFRGDLLSLRLFTFGEDEPFAFRLLSLALQQSLSPSVFIDIGANIGSLSIPLSQRYNCYSVCFEPQPALAEVLLSNADLNNVKHLVAVHCIALGSSSGFTNLYINSSHLGEASIRPLPNSVPLSVPIRRLDDVIDHGQWLNCAILKIDVEAFEKEVFEGAERLFSIHLPPIILEINLIALCDRGVDAIDTVNVLRRAGYTHFHALEEVLYPPENGTYLIANILATTNEHASLRSAYGFDAGYVPIDKPYRRVKPLMI
jgi:FkbM family methyltransferase